MPKDMGKVKVLYAFFASGFTGKLCSQASQLPDANTRVWGSEVSQ